MLTKGSLTSWRLLVGVIAVGVCVPAVARADGIPQTLPVERARTANHRIDTAPPIEWSDASGYVADARQGACTSHQQCSDCNPCTLDRCESLTCTHTPRDGASPTGCNDGLWCNGTETCSGTTCTPGTDVDCGDQVCDEALDACVDACADAGTCNDGLYCTDDACVDGVCIHTPTATCGPSGTCAEPSEGTTPVCGEGRCCDSGGGCTATTYGACTGDWLATEEPCGELPSGTPNLCPTYGSGIAPQGGFISIVGPISGLDCDDYAEIGDDYETDDHTTNPYMDLHILRFAGIVMPEANARWRISFYDENGVFVEDVFWPDGSNDAPSVDGATVKTVDFDPPLPVPTRGFVTWSVQSNFGPDGRVEVISTDGVDLGVNDADRMFANGVIIEQADTGPLAAGVRMLAFEIVGTPIDPPLGACCISASGLCAEVLPWTCEAANNVFQGIGSSCNVCQGNPFVSCNSVADCWACDSGTREEEKCNDAACPGGTCSTETGLCVGGDNEGEHCDCPGGGTCTDVSGAEGCVNVPPACLINACCDTEFGDCEQVTGGLCSGSSDPCDNDAECTGEETCEPQCPSGYVARGYGSDCDPNCCAQPGGTGGDNCTLITKQVITVPPVGAPPITITLTGNNSGATFDEYPDINNSGIFNPEGADLDPGWWEGFSIDDCANVRVDLCCTSNNGIEARPNWGSLWTTCAPPDITVGQNGVDPPVGVGRGTSGFARGGPFCDEDNIWGTWGPLSAGDYYYPIYSAFDSTMATASGGGDYQLHITVQACQDAACCLHDYTCVDGNEFANACNPDIQCPGGKCVDNVCDGGDNDTDPCDPNVQCTTGVCTLCAVVNELECAAADGYWLAGLNIPPDMDAVVTCDFDPCATGSCCTGPGECVDEVIGGQPMTLDDCEGEYVGNALCDYPTPPCPACEIAGAGNCQLPDLSASSNDFLLLSDLSTPPNGVVTADDFIATETTISTVCAWGAYLSRDLTFCDGNDGCDCNDLVYDNFRITVYADNNGIPGAVVGQSTVSAVVEGPVSSGFATPALFPDCQLYEYQLPLDSPINVLSPGTKYWLEIANNTECIDDPNDDTCVWHWGTMTGGPNNYCAIGTGDGYTDGSGRANVRSDMAFCLNQNLDPPPDVVGVCCNCADSACSTSTLAVCDGGSGRGVWVRSGEDCGSVTCGDLTVPPNNLCVDATPITGSQVIQFDTGCATTDPTAESHGSLGMGRDLWYAWTVGCAGRVVVSMCGTGNAEVTYDSVLAVYYDQNDPTNCPCPNDNGMTVIGTNADMDEGCNTVGDGGAGIIFPPPQAAENCLMVRVGGYNAQGGRGMLQVSCREAECSLASQPEPETLALPFDPPSQKIRYISFSAGDEGMNQAVRVTFANVPAPYDTWNGVQLYVQQPEVYCENAGTSQPVAPATTCPTAAGGLPQNWFWGATLGCDPYLTDWTQYDAVHVFDEGIIPNGDYDLAAIEEGCTVLDGWETNPDVWSPVVRWTQSRWADLIEDCSVTPCKPPDGNTGIVDVTAILDKWKNLPGNVQKARADIEGSPAGDHRLPDQSINITDVTYCLGAFLGDQYPGPGFPPASPPPVCP